METERTMHEEHYIWRQRTNLNKFESKEKGNSLLFNHMRTFDGYKQPRAHTTYNMLQTLYDRFFAIVLCHFAALISY